MPSIFWCICLACVFTKDHVCYVTVKRRKVSRLRLVHYINTECKIISWKYSWKYIKFYLSIFPVVYLSSVLIVHCEAPVAYLRPENKRWQHRMRPAEEEQPEGGGREGASRLGKMAAAAVAEFQRAQSLLGTDRNASIDILHSIG